MSIATKTAAVLLATTALCGIGSLAAAAYADTPAQQPALPKTAIVTAN